MANRYDHSRENVTTYCEMFHWITILQCWFCYVVLISYPNALQTHALITNISLIMRACLWSKSDAFWIRIALHNRLHLENSDEFMGASRFRSVTNLPSLRTLCYIQLLSSCLIIIKLIPLTTVVRKYWTRLVQGPLLLTWFNFNPSMDMSLHLL